MKMLFSVFLLAMLVGGQSAFALNHSVVQSNKPLKITCFGDNDTKLFDGKLKELSYSYVNQDGNRTFHRGKLESGETIEMTCRHYIAVYE